MMHDLPLQEEVKRQLEKLTSASQRFDKALYALQHSFQQEAMLAQWRKGQTAEEDYMHANDWLVAHKIKFTFNQEEKRYVLIQEDQAAEPNKT